MNTLVIYDLKIRRFINIITREVNFPFSLVIKVFCEFQQLHGLKGGFSQKGVTAFMNNVSK